MQQLRIKSTFIMFLLGACIHICAHNNDTAADNVQATITTAKTYVQTTLHQFKESYPIEYQAAKNGALPGLVAGIAKHMTPLVPKRGNNVIVCALLGIAAGSIGNIIVQKNGHKLIALKRLVLSQEARKELPATVITNVVTAVLPDDKTKAAGSASTDEQKQEQENAPAPLTQADINVLIGLSCGIAYLLA